MTSNVSGVLRQVFTWVFTAVYVPLILLVCLVISSEKRAKVGPKMVRGWGKTVLFVARIKVTVTPTARLALASRQARVLTFNHASTLDVPVGASLLPDGGVLAIKEEMRKIPFMGKALVALGSVFIDRGNRDAAYASLETGAQRIRDEVLQVLIAPEGTRSSDGSLGRFKRGAFHLAHASKVPMLPIVLHGCARVWPMGHFAPTPGHVMVDTLDPFHVAEGSREGLIEAADELRSRYEKALLEGC